jgi:hypothetical protein
MFLLPAIRDAFARYRARGIPAPESRRDLERRRGQVDQELGRLI